MNSRTSSHFSQEFKEFGRAGTPDQIGRKGTSWTANMQLLLHPVCSWALVLWANVRELSHPVEEQEARPHGNRSRRGWRQRKGKQAEDLSPRGCVQVRRARDRESVHLRVPVSCPEKMA